MVLVLRLDKLCRHNFKNNRCTKELRIMLRIIGENSSIILNVKIKWVMRISALRKLITAVICSSNESFISFFKLFFKASNFLFRRLCPSICHATVKSSLKSVMNLFYCCLHVFCTHKLI